MRRQDAVSFMHMVPNTPMLRTFKANMKLTKEALLILQRGLSFKRPRGADRHTHATNAQPAHLDE